MKQIKFRVWNKVEKKMGFILEMDFTKKKVYVKYLGHLYTYWDFKDIEFMQFIGYTDKYDREIFEGDILYDNKFGYEQKYVIISNDTYGSSYKVFNSTAPSHSPGKVFIDEISEGFYTKDSEIIGNKYENPKLLKGNLK